MRKLPPKEKRFVVATKWNRREIDFLDICAARRGMSRSAYLRWLAGKEKIVVDKAV